MSAKDRLQAMQAALTERGVRDVKFFFSSESMGTLTQAAEGAAVVLEAYLNGQCVPATKYDRPIA